MHLMRSHPLRFTRSLITGDSARVVNSPAAARKWFYSKGTLESDVARYAAMLCTESQRAGIELARSNLVETARVTTPVLVLGATLDACVTATEVQDTARAYRTDAVIFDGMGHNMMLEPGWDTVAECIDSWLTARNL
jgi:alpha-beta hydrolase superfamily lysophospholipase